MTNIEYFFPPIQTLEGRTVRTLADLRDFVDAALAVPGIDATCIDLDQPHDMRLVRRHLANGEAADELEVTRW